MDLSTLTLEDFAPYLNHSFAAEAEGLAPIRMELVEAKLLRGWTPGEGRRKGFEVLFRITGGDLPEQRTLTLSHPNGSTWTYFCVPVLVPKPGRFVQAIFN